ncbi:PEP/pyruvate-binding domain-containing protein [Actinomadura violacea]|uniref:Phosphoenolpyruvate synthase n=1 Tax=Actinomadura violacea TaxID=2819934 RepID=A0ABS3RM90_9ACTN|nr:PEP/pyruvate-binding domain-containing protein [Actinomadura violacea]MBO2457843.1 hypothetical protein [Actinomadura violacea]
MSGVPAGSMSTGEVGHQFARLDTLRDAGFPVPEFFCVPASEFDRALDGLSGALPPRSAVPGAQWCGFAASALAGAVPDGALAARLLAGFDELTRGGAGSGGGTVAVRAFAVPGPDGAAEDSAGDPFAGLSDSFLYVRRDGLLEAVARCWASAFKAEAVRYREFRGLDPAAARVAVGVQRMVPGGRSFVAFTRDPRDGARRHVIAAAHGIGEGVVQEKADVDHFFVDPGTGRVEAEVVTKDRMVGPPADGGEGPRTVRVPDELRVPPVLTGEQAGEVADLVARVEVLFGCPQDIEGTITPDGAVHLVQARPLAAPPERAREARAEHRWPRARVAAALPALAWRAAGHRRATVRFLRWWDALMADVRGPAARPLAEYTPDELITLYRWVWAEASVRWGVTLANGVYGLLLMRAATALPRRWAGAGPEVLPGLLCGGPENRSLAAARAALVLAERAAGAPALKAALLADDLGGRTDEEHLRAVWDDVAAGRHGAFLAASARAYLRRCGDRAVHDLKLDEPTPRQRPWMTAAVLRPLVRQGATAAASRAAEAREAAGARRRLRESCPGPAKRAVLRVLLGMMRWSVPAACPPGEQDAAAADGTLRGLGSCGGTVRGRAKVVLDPRVPPGDCAGRILVARETDPGWLALMIAASGPVVERGTLLSHTAVTGRLLGVPTAVAVGGAVARIPDGAWIELDGRSGTVRILGAPAGAAG